MTLDEAIKHAEDAAKQAEEHARYIRYMGRYGWEKECNEYNNLVKSHLQIAKWLKELKAYRKMYRGLCKMDGDPVDIDKAVEHYEKTLETLKGIDLEVGE